MIIIILSEINYHGSTKTTIIKGFSSKRLKQGIEKAIKYFDWRQRGEDEYFRVFNTWEKNGKNSMVKAVNYDGVLVGYYITWYYN